MPAFASPDPEYLTPVEAAQILKMSTAGVALYDHVLEPLRIGRRGVRAYARVRVEAFAAARAAKAARGEAGARDD